jgi:uroporphyrinogen-III decarboxylase
MSTSLNRVMAAIRGSNSHPPVVIPYLQYYLPEVVEVLTPYSREELEGTDTALIVEALSQMHAYFDCDWVRVTVDRSRMLDRLGGRLYRLDDGPVTAEELLEMGLYDVAREVTRRFRGEKFVYGRVGIPYGALFGDWSDIEGAMVALKREPDRSKRVMEDSIPQRLEEIRAWAEVGVHGLWLGQWMCSADMISEADYLEFIYPYDKIIIDAVREAGLVGIYHFCGDAIPRIKHIKTYPPTVLGVEESKKGFEVDIGRVRAEAGREICLLGNIDVYEIVEKGTPEGWAKEVARQIRQAGPERFIVSCGSPITPDTPPERLREFIATAKQVRDR